MRTSRVSFLAFIVFFSLIAVSKAQEEQSTTPLPDPNLMYFTSTVVAAASGASDRMNDIANHLWILKGQRDPIGGITPGSLYLERHKWLKDKDGTILGTRIATGDWAASVSSQALRKNGQTFYTLLLPPEGGGQLTISYKHENFNPTTKEQAFIVEGVQGLPSFEAGGEPSKVMAKKQYNWKIKQSGADIDIYGQFNDPRNVGETIEAKIDRLELGLKTEWGFSGLWKGITNVKVKATAEVQDDEGGKSQVPVEDNTTVYEEPSETHGSCAKNDLEFENVLNQIKDVFKVIDAI